MHKAISSEQPKNGMRMTYHDNGKKCEQGLYKDGKRHGECISWYPNGEKELHAYFRNGRPCNIWINWDKDGNYDWINMDINR